MRSLGILLRLGLGGLLLDPQIYREQRDAPDGLRRGFALVVLVGLLVGAAAMVGDLLESLAQPGPATIADTLYNGVRRTPWFAEQAAANPAFAEQFAQTQAETVANMALFGGGPLASLGQLLLSPIFALAGWLIGGTVAHLVARALGGAATLSQTLSATAAAAGVNLIGLVQVVPFAQAAGTLLLGLIATYVAIRETHGLPAWRGCWAVMAGPLLLALLAALFACIVAVFFVGLVGAASGA